MSRDYLRFWIVTPDERLVAFCPAEHGPLLRHFDHHTVFVGARLALLLTAPWTTKIQPDHQRFRFLVSFTYAAGHPRAPKEVQNIATATATFDIP